MKKLSGWGDLEFWDSGVWVDIQDYLKAYPDYYPENKNIFKALISTPVNTVKVVILGQDPYHTEGMADGLAFSVKNDVHPFPPSLRNIFKELHDDLGIQTPKHGNLMKWAREGVLLLNTVLTVKPHAAQSHRMLGWQVLTEEICRRLAFTDHTIVFILWGNEAQEYKSVIGTNPRIVSAHPSPLSAHQGFFGSKPFSRANHLLAVTKKTPIRWDLNH